MCIRDRHGLFHGGVTTAIVDSACGYSALTLMAAGSEVLTVESVSYTHLDVYKRQVRVRWKTKGGVVEVEVSDGGGPSVPRPAPQALWSTSGRGLRIVRSLAHEWGVLDDKGGRTVWASLGGPSRRRTH